MHSLYIKIYESFNQEKYKFLGCGFILGLIIGLAIYQNSSFFWALLGAFLSLILYLVYMKITPWFEKTYIKAKLSQLLGPMYDENEECIIFITELKNIERKLQNYQGQNIVGTDRVVGTGDALALPYLYNLLVKAGKRNDKINVVRSFDNVNQYFDKNFISVGGLTNRVSKMLFNDYIDKFEFSFSKNGNAIIKKYPDNHRQYVEITEDYDYGIISKISNLNHDGKILFVIAGINDMGTAGAAYYLYENYKRLVDTFADYDFSLVIRVSRSIGEKSATEFNFDENTRDCS